MTRGSSAHEPESDSIPRSRCSSCHSPTPDSRVYLLVHRAFSPWHSKKMSPSPQNGGGYHSIDDRISSFPEPSILVLPAPEPGRGHEFHAKRFQTLGPDANIIWIAEFFLAPTCRSLMRCGSIALACWTSDPWTTHERTTTLME